jgi:hypothetical protein
MPTCDIYGFAHEDIDAARRAIESALSIRLEEVQESDLAGCYYRMEFQSGPCVQIRRNSGPFLRWQSDPSHPWLPEFGLLVFVHGVAPESIAQHLLRVPGLSFLEQKETMC